jgi:hypothetical protein
MPSSEGVLVIERSFWMTWRIREPIIMELGGEKFNERGLRVLSGGMGEGTRTRSLVGLIVARR